MGSQGRLRDDFCDKDWIFDRKVETASPAEIEAVSDDALRNQLADLSDRSPFYRQKFRSARVDVGKVRHVDELRHLPFTAKSDLKEAQQRHPPLGDHLAVPLEQVKRIYQTSGTTGEPSVLALTVRDLHDVWGTIALRAYWGSGYHDHSSVVCNFGAGPFVAGTIHRVFERIGARTIPVAPNDTDRLVHAMSLGLADSIQGTPSFVLHLVSRFEKEGIDARRFGIVHVNVGGEPGAGMPSVRERIEGAFGAQLTEIMGLGDVAPSLFAECPVGGGMHFCGQGLVWMELVDPGNEEPVQIEPGAKGEPVYTHLKREAMPLIRFKSGDFVEIQDSTCPCGRTSFRIRCIGRVDDMIIVRGVNVYPSAVQAVVSGFRPLVTGRVRLVVPGTDVVVSPPVLIEVEQQHPANGSPTLAAEIERAIRKRLIFKANVRLVPEADFGSADYKTRGLVRREEKNL